MDLPWTDEPQLPENPLEVGFHPADFSPANTTAPLDVPWWVDEEATSNVELLVETIFGTRVRYGSPDASCQNQLRLKTLKERILDNLDANEIKQSG